MDAISFSPTLSRLKLPTHHHHRHRHPSRTLLHFPRLRLRRPVSAFFRDQSPTATPDPSFGEVSRIIGSRTLPPPAADLSAAPTTEYLLEWKDGHPSSWCPASAIAADVLADYESPWWTAAKKPDPSALSSLLSDPAAPRDPDLLDADGRTALHFVAGLGCEDSVRALASGGGDVNRPDRSGGGLTPLHMAAGYARPGAVRALLEAGADPAAVDGKGRTALDLVKEVLAATPRAQLARRLTLEAVVRELEAAVYEFSEVAQVLEGRGKGERREYLVEWKEGGREWVKAAWVAEDLVRDYEAGLEYGVAEAVVGARPATEGRRELLVKWVDMQEETWEPEENVDVELIRDYDERMAKKQQQQEEESSAAIGSPQ